MRSIETRHLLLPVLMSGVSLVSGLRAQQFRVELAADVLDQVPLRVAGVVTAADLDGDGRQDLVFAGPRAWFGRGSHFVAGPAPAPVSFPGLPLAVDVDGDGDRDVVDLAVGQLRLFRNDGVGGLVDDTSGHMPTTTFFGDRVFAADVDLDGDQDLLLPANKLLLNDGLGGFTDATAARIAAAGFSIAQSMVVADLDGDGDVDFVTMTGLFRNDGAGFFQLDDPAGAGFAYAEVPMPSDVDGDGDLDVVLSTGRLLRNDGTGGFTSSMLWSAASSWQVLAVADLDGDLDDDLVLGPSFAVAGEGVTAVANDGSGVFDFGGRQRLPFATAIPGAMLAVDLDGDGDRDLVATRPLGRVPSPAEVVLRDGDGWRLATLGAERNTSRQFARLAFDADGDGDDDLLAWSVLQRNQGGGVFVDEPLPFGAAPARPLAAADVDGDGATDVLASNGLWRGDGSGGFAAAAPQFGSPQQAAAAVLFDLDGDGDRDAAIALVATGGAALQLYRNTGGALAAFGAPLLVGATALAAGDVDGDGDRDLVVGTGGLAVGLASVVLLRNDGAAGFAPLPLPGATPFAVRAVFARDFDGDGDLDVLTESSGPSTLFDNLGGGAFAAVPQPALAGLRLLPDDFDLDGDVDLWTAFQGGLVPFVNGGGAFTAAPGRLGGGAAPDPIVDFALVDFDGDGDRDVMAFAQTAATQEMYSVPVWNHARQLRLPHAAATGGTFDVQLTATEPTLGRFAALLVSGATASVPLGDVGVLGVDPAAALSLFVPLPNDGSSLDLALPVPAGAALRGAFVAVQALFFGDALRLGNVLSTTVLN